MSTKSRTEVSNNKEVLIDTTMCLACGACTSVCPAEALIIVGLKLIAYKERCISCGIAEKVCPTGALICPKKQ